MMMRVAKAIKVVRQHLPAGLTLRFSHWIRSGEIASLALSQEPMSLKR